MTAYAGLSYNRSMAVERTPIEVGIIIRGFLNGTGGKWDWDDFISTPLSDSRLDEVRRLCGELPDRFPPHEEGSYCDENGLQLLRQIAADLPAER